MAKKNIRKGCILAKETEGSITCQPDYGKPGGPRAGKSTL